MSGGAHFQLGMSLRDIPPAVLEFHSSFSSFRCILEAAHVLAEGAEGVPRDCQQAARYYEAVAQVGHPKILACTFRGED
jgi:hypothetical protein